MSDTLRPNVVVPHDLSTQEARAAVLAAWTYNAGVASGRGLAVPLVALAQLDPAAVVDVALPALLSAVNGASWTTGRCPHAVLSSLHGEARFTVSATLIVALAHYAVTFVPVDFQRPEASAMEADALVFAASFRGASADAVELAGTFATLTFRALVLAYGGPLEALRESSRIVYALCDPAEAAPLRLVG